MGKYGKIVEGIQNQQAAPLLLGTKHAAIGGQFVPAERRCWVGLVRQSFSGQ